MVLAWSPLVTRRRPFTTRSSSSVRADRAGSSIWMTFAPARSRALAPLWGALADPRAGAAPGGGVWVVGPRPLWGGCRPGSGGFTIPTGFLVVPVPVRPDEAADLATFEV